MMTKTQIESGHVYTTAAGHTRLVLSVGPRGDASAVVIWRTADPDLPAAQRSHGSCSLGNFARDADRSTKATQAHWNAFELVQRRRAWQRVDRRAIRAWKLRHRR